MRGTMSSFVWKENELVLEIRMEEGKEVLLKYFGLKTGFKNVKNINTCRIAEIQVQGNRNASFRGSKNFYDSPQLPLHYLSHRIEKNKFGRKIIIVQQNMPQNKGQLIEVTSYIQFYTGISAVRSWTEVANKGTENLCLEGVTSFCYGNLGNGTVNIKDKVEICFAHNTWSAECRWIKRTLKECGVIPYGNLSYDRMHIYNSSGLSSGEYLPMGAAGNKERKEYIAWQIENNGSWAWEIGAVIDGYCEPFMEKDYSEQESIYLQLSGPRLEESHWRKILAPGERFFSVPAAIAVSSQSIDYAFTELNLYRRNIIPKPLSLPVIYNDYMNGFMGNSTTEKLMPQIQKAAEAGCEIFVVDCGWYSSKSWQYSFGKYQESKERYPAGLKVVMDEIRSKGMIPGIWLELETFGMDCDGLECIPKEWFFYHGTQPVIDSGRYQLDFRNPSVQEHAEKIVDMIVEKYQVGYIKLDYNMCCGLGTDSESDSLGDGLLEHTRAYILWFCKIHRKYPHMLFENCASGGLRMDYAMLSMTHIQSVSDQEDYRRMGIIAASCPSAVLPEQAGIWSYPLENDAIHEVIFNMVNSILFRMHLGGILSRLNEEQFMLVKEGIAVHRVIRQEIIKGIPHTGIFEKAEEGYQWYQMETEDGYYIAVWRLQSAEGECSIRLAGCIPGQEQNQSYIQVLYPPGKYQSGIVITKGAENISVKLPQDYSACVIRLQKDGW